MSSLEYFQEKVTEIVGSQWVFDDPSDRYPYARDIVKDIYLLLPRPPV
jgi:hypothetical protein